MYITKYLWALILLILVVRIFIFFNGKTEFENGTVIRVQSKVKSEPYIFSKSQSVLAGGYFIYLPLYPEINYGDKIIVEGTVQDKKLLNAKLIELYPTDNLLFNFRKKLLDIYTRSMPQDNAALVAGMSIGSKTLIKQNFREKLKSSGTAHVVVASGMNITLVAGFLINSLINVMNRRKAIIIAFMGIWLYAILAGFEAPIVRAAIMASLAFGAQKLGRLNYAWRTLIISASLMVIVKPEWLVDLGFILSFAATASLMMFEHVIKRKLNKVPRFFREDLSSTLAAQVLVAPILFLYFKQINLVSPLANVLVLWTVPIITLSGMAAGLAGLVFYPLGKLILVLIYPLTEWFVYIVSIFS